MARNKRTSRILRTGERVFDPYANVDNPSVPYHDFAEFREKLKTAGRRGPKQNRSKSSSKKYNKNADLKQDFIKRAGLERKVKEKADRKKQYLADRRLRRIDERLSRSEKRATERGQTQGSKTTSGFTGAISSEISSTPATKEKDRLNVLNQLEQKKIAAEEKSKKKPKKKVNKPVRQPKEKIQKKGVGVSPEGWKTLDGKILPAVEQEFSSGKNTVLSREKLAHAIRFHEQQGTKRDLKKAAQARRQLEKLGPETIVDNKEVISTRLEESSKRASSRSGSQYEYKPVKSFLEGKEKYKGNLFNQVKDKIISLDIETSGLNEKKDFIWSMGTATESGTKEHFIKPPNAQQKERLLENNIFGIKGYFDEYKSAISSNKATSLEGGLKSIFNEIDKGSMLLIQNLNFENKFIAEALNNTGMAEDMTSKFKYVSEDHKGKLLYSPPGITTARHEAMRQQALLSKTTDTKKIEQSVKNLSSIYNNIMSSYASELSQKKGTVIVELMDISNAVFSLAAEKNYLSAQNIGSGKSVNFLKQSLFTGTGLEKHTAAADAKDQMKIFSKLSEMYTQLSTGNLSQSNIQALGRIRAAHPYESSKTFVSSLRSTLEEIKREGTTKLINPLSIQEYNKTVSGKVYKDLAPDYKDPSIPITSNPADARAHVVEKFINSDMKGINPEEFSKSLDSKSLSEQIDLLKKEEKRLSGRVTGILEGSQSKFDSVGDIWSRMKHKGKISIGLGTLGVLGAAYSVSNDKQEDSIDYEQRRDQASYQRSNDRSFKMYSDPQVYHGTSLYLWQNSVKHHEY